MRLVQRLASVSDRGLSRLLKIGVIILVVGVPAFGAYYYHDQHPDRGPSLIDRTVAAAEQGVRKAPADIGLRLKLAATYDAARRPDAAMTQYNQVLSVQSDNRVALLGRSDILLAKRDLTGATKGYQALVSASGGEEFSAADPQLEKAYYRLGQIALQRGHVRTAVAQLTAALRIEPTDADALYLLGSAKLRGGQAAQAVQALHQAVAFVPTGWCAPYFRMSEAYRQLGQAAQADYATAMVDFCGGRPDAAKRRLTKLTSGPVAVDAMLGLGMIAENQSDRAAAKSWYQKVVDIDAKNFIASTGLARLSEDHTTAGGVG
jgi:tetratricopeptide (TPR) repeat protein